MKKLGHRERIVAALKEHAAAHQSMASTGGGGGGDGTPDSTADCTSKTSQTVGAGAQDDVVVVRVHACTGRDAAYLFSSIHRVLSQNNLRSGVRLLHRHVEALAPVAAVGASLPPLGLWGTFRDFFCHLLHDDEPKLTTDWKQN